MRKKLQKTAIALLALVSLYSLVSYWNSIRKLNTVVTGADAVDAWEARLEPVKQALPIRRGVVGYIADWDVPGVKYGFGDVEAEYFLSQYTLAPLILVRGPIAEWNIAVLSPKAFQIWEQINRGKFEIVFEKNNVYLLRNLEPQ